MRQPMASLAMGSRFQEGLHWGRLLRCKVTARVTVLSDPFVITFDGKEDRAIELQTLESLTPQCSKGRVEQLDINHV